jgi:DtxR family transcriptional regulator, Mn-dependent transcriptional regulator
MLCMCAVSSRPDREGCCSAVLTVAVEDYLKAVFDLTTRDRAASASTLAQALGVAPPSVSAMLKRLAADGLIVRHPGHHVELTEHGRRHAVAVVRRHRLIEDFLVKVLDVPWEEVHAEAEVLEHAVSDRLIERIDAFLAHPTHDPHGDPIPPGHGVHVERWTTPLAQVRPQCRFRVQRVSDRDSAALRYLGELGIRPGVVIDVTERAPFGGPLWVEVDGRRTALGDALADNVFGEPA